MVEVFIWRFTIGILCQWCQESGDTMENILLPNIVQDDQFDQFVIDCLGKHIH